MFAFILFNFVREYPITYGSRLIIIKHTHTGEEEMVDVEGEGQDDEYPEGMEEGDFEGGTENEAETNEVDVEESEVTNQEAMDGDQQEQDDGNLNRDLEMTPDNSPNHSDHDDNASHYSDDENRGILLTRSGFQAASSSNAQQEDEEMIDENYDPSEFLLQGDFQFPNTQAQNVNGQRAEADEAAEGEGQIEDEGTGNRRDQPSENAYEVMGKFVNVNVFLSPKETLLLLITFHNVDLIGAILVLLNHNILCLSVADESRQEAWPQENQDDAMDSDGAAIHNDLVISESEEEHDDDDDENNRENQQKQPTDEEDNHEDDEDDGIWF